MSALSSVFRADKPLHSKGVFWGGKRQSETPMTVFTESWAMIPWGRIESNVYWLTFVAGLIVVAIWESRQPQRNLSSAVTQCAVAFSPTNSTWTVRRANRPFEVLLYFSG